MKNDEFATRNIVLLFDESLNEEFIKLSNQINQVASSKVVLNMENMIPHLTIYGAKFPRKNLKMLEERLSSLAKKDKAIRFEIYFKKCCCRNDIYRCKTIKRSLLYA